MQRRKKERRNMRIEFFTRKMNHRANVKEYRSSMIDKAISGAI
jgi:hypothetical protein